MKGRGKGRKRRGNGKKQKLGTEYTPRSLSNEKLDKLKKGRNGFEISLFLSLRLFILFPPRFIGFQYIGRCLFPILYIYIYFIIFHRISSDIGVDEEHPTCPLTRQSIYFHPAWLKNSLYRSRLTDQSVL